MTEARSQDDARCSEGFDRSIARSSDRPMLVSFSGIDGAGKTTQITNLLANLESWGCRTKLLAFWDDVVVLKKYREGFVHKVYGSERGVGAPGKPVVRRDKNMRSWYLTVARHILYLLDTVNLRRVLARERKSKVDVIVMDRFIYDELANLPLSNVLSRAFIRILVKLIRRPDLAFVLDADPEAASNRKPEYPVDFMRECRGWYLRLTELLGTMTVIPPLPLEQAKLAVVGGARSTIQRRSPRNSSASGGSLAGRVA